MLSRTVSQSVLCFRRIMLAAIQTMGWRMGYEIKRELESERDCPGGDVEV